MYFTTEITEKKGWTLRVPEKPSVISMFSVVSPFSCFVKGLKP